MSPEDTVIGASRTHRCPAVSDGSFWKPSRCREDADHSGREHHDQYVWSGVQYADEHAPHDHHVDGYGRTWRGVS